MQLVQAPSSVMMVRPAMFNYNEETAVSNAFQRPTEAPDSLVREAAIEEFDSFVEVLRAAGVNVAVFDDSILTHTPDAVFPNNWIAFMPDGIVYLFPMEADNRRMERRMDIPEALRDEYHFRIDRIIDISENELKGRFLEGTGSIVFDHINKIAYANQSTRTHPELFAEFCDLIRYSPVLFQANDQNGNMIYHTNVMMALGEKFAVVCIDSIDTNLRYEVLGRLQETQHEIIDISFQQVTHFAGNMIELSNQKGERLIIMSSQAHSVLDQGQVTSLEKYGQIIHSPIPTIEKLGGGSVRCMVAGIHTPLANEIGE